MKQFTDPEEVAELNRGYKPRGTTCEAYYWGDWYFARVPDGKVRISFLTHAQPPVIHAFVPPEEWNAIVKFVK